MASYPSSIIVPREYENRSGVVYDESDKKRIFAEDFENLWNEIIAIENALGVDVDETLSYIAGICSDFEDHVELPCHTNNYKCRVYLNNNKTATKNAWSKVAFDTEDYDPNNNFDNATNFRYIAPVNGYYLINATVGIITPSGGAMPTTMSVAIYVDGAERSRGDLLLLSLSSSQLICCNVGDIVYLAKDSYVEIYGYNGGSASNNSTYSGVEARTHMSAFLISQ